MIAPDGDASKMEDMDLVNEEDEDETLARCLQPVLVIVPRTLAGDDAVAARRSHAPTAHNSVASFLRGPSVWARMFGL